MIIIQEAREAQCDARLALKTQDQALIRRAIDGAGLTPWEASVLPQVVREIYLSEPGNRPIEDGQVRYQAVSIKAGAGRKMVECPLVPVVLTVIDVDDDREVLRAQGAVALRRSKVMRIAEESREQGGVLTQEDLGVLVGCDARTIRRDVQALRSQGIFVPTRGFLHDIGPTLTHKAQAIRHWLDGKEPVAITRAINHSLHAVERYLEDFKRVSLMLIKGLDAVAIARAGNLSPALVETYQAMYAQAQQQPEYAYRFQELTQLATDQPTESQPGGKKGAM
jgi:Protein of unknown function (DUF1670)